MTWATGAEAIRNLIDKGELEEVEPSAESDSAFCSMLNSTSRLLERSQTRGISPAPINSPMTPCVRRPRACLPCRDFELQAVAATSPSKMQWWLSSEAAYGSSDRYDRSDSRCLTVERLEHPVF